MGFFKPNVEKMEAKRDIKGLINVLKDKESLERWRAIEALEKIGEPSVKPLTKTLKNRDEHARHWAATALGEIGNASVVEPLIEALKDENWFVRCGVADALGKITDVRVMKPLGETLNDNHWNVRLNAVEALAKKGVPSVELLLKALKDKSGWVRASAAVALGNMGDARAVEPLIEALKEELTHNVNGVPEALGNLGDEVAAPALTIALMDSDPGIRKASAKALAQIGADEKKTRDGMLKLLKESECAGYFECDDRPSGDGVCSDNNCPCREDKIPRGAGYLYIDQALVDFRRTYPSMNEAREAMLQKIEGLRASGLTFGSYRIGPILVCEKGAKLRNMDLKIAADDAKIWWETGKVRLRATPHKDN